MVLDSNSSHKTVYKRLTMANRETNSFHWQVLQKGENLEKQSWIWGNCYYTRIPTEYIEISLSVPYSFSRRLIMDLYNISTFLALIKSRSFTAPSVTLLLSSIYSWIQYSTWELNHSFPPCTLSIQKDFQLPVS